MYNGEDKKLNCNVFMLNDLRMVCRKVLYLSLNFIYAKNRNIDLHNLKCVI